MAGQHDIPACVADAARPVVGAIGGLGYLLTIVCSIDPIAIIWIARHI
jgi:hypothetical protein